MHRRTFLLPVLAGLVLSVCLAQTAFSETAANEATTPVARGDGWWKDRHAGNVAAFEKGDIELLLIGDSITHGWDNHKDLYDKYFGKYKPVNMGFSGDRTQHVLWRLDNLPLDKIQPKVAQIMIGTNNIGHASTGPKETAQGIVAIVEKLEKTYPKLQIIVLNVFPRDEAKDGKNRKLVDELNSYLPALLKGHKNVELVDINAGFLDKDGKLPKSIMPDSLHPNKEGDEYWGKTIEPYIEKAVKKYDRISKSSKRQIARPRLFR